MVNTAEIVDWDQPSLEEGVFDIEAETLQEPTIYFYNDGHIVIGDAAYEVDNLCDKLLRTMARHPGGIEIADLHRQFFGGYKGYTRPSPAQLVRFQEAVDYFSSIESELGVGLFTIYSREDAPERKFFEPNFKAKRYRQPYIEAELEFEATELEAEEQSADLLNNDQQQVLTLITDLKNYSPEHEGRMYRKTVNQVMFGSEKATFDQNVYINKTIESLNEWFARYGINLQLKSIATPQGPAIQISNALLLGKLKSEIDLLELQIKERFELAIAESRAHSMVASANQTTKRQKQAKKPTVIVPKEVVKRSSSPYVAAFNISPALNERDLTESSVIADEIGLESSDVLAVRILLGKAIRDNTLPTGEQEAKIISFLQSVQARLATNQESGSSSINYQMWADASFSVLILSYEKRINNMAGTLARGNDTLYEELRLAGLRGLQDGVGKFTPDNGNPKTYLPLRIHGEMVDYMRSSIGGPRDEAKRLQVVSINEPAFINRGRSSGTELTVEDTITSIDPYTESLMDIVEGGGAVEEQELLRKGLEKIINQAGNSRKIEQDIRLTIFHYGIESLMSPEDRELYRSLKSTGERDGKDGLLLRQLGEIFGFGESRACQIVSKTVKSLRTAIELELQSRSTSSQIV